MIWKAVDGYDGLYEVSYSGEIRRNGKKLSHNVNRKTGYHSVHLCKNGVIKRIYVHRIVAMAFVPNPYGYPLVNHKNEDKGDNNASNLEWCTAMYNNRYGSNAPVNVRRKKVAQFSPSGDLLYTYDSATAASKAVGVSRQYIGKCCLGRGKTAGGYQWHFV